MRGGGQANYEGSVALVSHHACSAPSAGRFALDFVSANYQRRTYGWTGGRWARTAAPTCPFAMQRTGLAAGRHTVVVRVDWRDPDGPKLGFHRTWFNWGGLDGEVDVRPVGESDLAKPAIDTRWRGSEPPARAVQRQRQTGVKCATTGLRAPDDPEGSLTGASRPSRLAFTASAPRARRREILSDPRRPSPNQRCGRPRLRTCTR